MDKRWVLAGFYGPIVLAVVVLGLGFMNPGYSHIRDVISELGQLGAPTEHLMNLFGFGLFGVFVFVFAAGIHAIRGTSFVGKLASAFFAAGGISCSLISINTNPMHLLASTCALFLLFPAFLLLALDTRKERSMRYYFLTSAVLGIATFYFGVGWLGTDSEEESLTSGIKQRASMSAWLIHMMYTSRKLYNLKRVG